MQKTILLFALLAVSGFALSVHFEELNILWGTWKALHSKSYTSDAEDAARYAIFVDNYDKIIQHNARQTSYKLRLNQFADLTGAEFKNTYAGCARVEENEEIIRANSYVVYEDFEVPKSVDWRGQNAVTPVKDQGQCGSCWAFSTTGTVEGYYAITKGTLLSFSEQQIVDCASDAGQGCSGGWPYLAVKYAAQAGLEQESVYPYTAKNGDCNYDSTLTTKTNMGYKFVDNYSSDAMKAAIASMPVSVVVEADQNVFQFYSSGVVGNDSNCGDNLDHAILAVGYGSVDGDDAFIVKNSWGSNWGQLGYIYISTDGSSNGGAGVCGILSQPVIPR